MKNLIYCILIFIAANTALASTLCNNPAHNHNLKLNINQVNTLTINQDNENKQFVVQGDEEEEIVEMKDVKNISLKGKNPEDKVTFFMNGEKKSYKVSEIKAIKVRTVERAD